VIWIWEALRLQLFHPGGGLPSITPMARAGSGQPALKSAIEAFRQRQLAKIDAQLAEFGIDPPAPTANEQKPSYFAMILP
jgi:hypothetical protein